MTRKFTFAVACALICVVAWFAASPRAPRAAYKQRDQVQRWEYAMISINAGIQEVNRYGNEGWEMCGVLGGNSPTAVIFFKRPIN